MNFLDYSYQAHAKNFAKDLVDENLKLRAESWFNENTADYWRHARAYECADHLLPEESSATLLTIGDGRWGLDSIRIRNKGFAHVLPTDISETLLKAAKERGYIQEYSVENCERLSFADGSFDYVFCKESFHHFPRPYLALYEMLRVARRAVFLIEPNDPVAIISDNSAVIKVLRWTWQLLKKRHGRKPYLSAPLGTKIRLSYSLRNLLELFRPITLAEAKSVSYNHPAWETVGNYVYNLSRRELEKTAYGLNLKQIVFKGFNDHYIEGCEFEPADEDKSEIFRKIVENIRLADKACAAGLSDYNILMGGIFKRQMLEDHKTNFLKNGWEVKTLLENPYCQE